MIGAVLGAFFMQRLILLALCCLAAAFTLPNPAFAEKRVALVIGNSAYQNVPKLPNPANDAGAIADLLRAAKFDVVESKNDLNITDMRRAFRDFSDKVRDADIAVVYYAGHGLEIDGTNYLIPVDAILRRDTDAYDEAITLDRALQVIEPAKQLRLVILDACRDNPFAQSMKRTLASRSLGRGLAGVEPGKPNTLIAFAAKGGSTADDGNGAHSPFATSLLQHLTTPGLDIRRLLGLVRDDVMKATNDRQEPFVYGSLGGADVSLVPAPPAPAASAQGPAADPQAAIRRDYELALQINTQEAWQAFLQQYPTGFYAGLAKAQSNKIAAEAAQAAAAAKARQAEAEKARLAAEQATAAAQAKAAADARAAEQTRLAAEKLKLQEQAKAENAERVRAAAEQAAAEKAAKDKAAADVKAAEDTAKAQAAAADHKSVNVAALPADAGAIKPSATDDAKPAAQDIARSLQTELRRVGCFTGSIDGDWKAASQHALELFDKYGSTKLDVKIASLDAVDAVKSKTARVCPLICDHGYRADGETCVRITCDAGYEIGSDNTCEKKAKAKPVAKQSEPKKNPETSDATRSARAPAASGQLFCGQGGCRPVAKGCHLDDRGTGQPGYGAAREICN